MAVDIKRNSRLRFGNLETIDGVEFWDILELPELLPQEDDTSYRVLGTDRIDLLANKFYGDPVLWWVIALANDLELVPTSLSEGMVIRVPSARYIQQVVLAKAT